MVLLELEGSVSDLICEFLVRISKKIYIS